MLDSMLNIVFFLALLEASLCHFNTTTTVRRSPNEPHINQSTQYPYYWQTTQRPIGNYSTNCVATFNARYSNEKGAISSPFYPESYPNHVTCLWIFYGQPGLNISLNFRKFDTRKDLDFVDVYDGTIDENNKIAKLSGSNLPASQLEYLTQKEAMTVVFQSSESAEGSASGFVADYLIGCQDQIYTTKTGAFQTPNFPGPYPQGTSCRYYINVPAPAGYAVAIKFNNFDLGYNDDSVTFYDGLNDYYSNRFLRRSGRMRPWTVLAPGAQVTVQLSTSYWGSAGSGFDASYELVCGGGFYLSDDYYHYPRDPKVITSANYPQHYADNLDCNYVITAEGRNVVAIWFKDFDTEENEDFVSIYDGQSVDSPLIAKLSGSMTGAQAYMSSGQYMLIKFTSNSKGNRRGFKLIYDQFNLQNQRMPYSGEFTTEDPYYYTTGYINRDGPMDERVLREKK